MRFPNRPYLLLTLLALAWIAGPVHAACPHHTVEVVLSTPISSRIHQVGQPVKAVLAQDLILKDQPPLPAGSMLTGRVRKVQPSRPEKAGRIMVVFTRALPRSGESQPVTAMADTEDGWLDVADAGAVWQVSPQRSTRLLNQILLKRLGPDQAVWGQILGLRTNTIPDPTSDRFIQEYHRHDVLLGAGDTLHLRLGCPGLFEIK